MNPLKLTGGADPELVLVDAGGYPVSAIRVLNVNKDNPIDLGDGIKIYADNVLAEAAFTPVPMEGMVERIGQVLRRMKQAIGEYDILPQAAVTFPAKELTHVLMGEDGKPRVTAWDAGCSDNFGAYRRIDKLVNPKTKFTDGLRTGSFHIHIGNADWDKGEDTRLMTMESKIEAIKILDLYVGLSSIIWDCDTSAPIRRKLYGKAGEFRPTKYGIEYRVLGNYALCCPKLVKMVFELVNLSMRHVEDGSGTELLKQFDSEDVVYAINENNPSAARSIISQLDINDELMQTINNYVPKSTSISLNWGF